MAGVKRQLTRQEQLEQLMARYEEINSFFIEKVAEQILRIGELNAASMHRIEVMAKMNEDIGAINRRLAQATRLSVRDLYDLYDKAMTDLYRSPRFERALNETPLPDIEKQRLSNYVEMVARQTAGRMVNYSNTTAVSERYRQMVDRAILATSSGMEGYKAAMRQTVRELGQSGMQVYYESGHHRRLDTAVRQNIVDGMNQIAQHGSDMMGEALGYDAYELSAHAASAPDHEPVQGRVFLKEEFAKMQSGQPCEDVDGRQYEGFRRRIGEWNCMHIAMSFDTRRSIRRYTDAQLADWAQANENGCEIDGKHYTLYEARQLMRRIETQIRREKDTANAARIAGDDDLRRQCQERINALSRKYTQVAQASGFKPRRDRMTVEGFRAVKTNGTQGGAGGPLMLSKDLRYDTEQYERYKKVMGDEAPKTLEEFVQIKYTDAEGYGQLKHTYRIANQYEHNSGEMSASDIVRLHDEAARQKALFTSDARKMGNIGIMEMDGEVYIASSKVKTKEEKWFVNFEGDKESLVLLPEQQRFHTIYINGKGEINGPESYDRIVDSEAKLFEHAARVADDGQPHMIKMLSEKHMCESCQGVMKEFKERYPNVTVQVVSHREDRAEANHNHNRVFEFDARRAYERKRT